MLAAFDASAADTKTTEVEARSAVLRIIEQILSTTVPTREIDFFELA
jgi:hypothetical protein